MKQMDITVFDEHHEALIFWADSFAKNRFRKNATLLHVDEHADIDVPRMTESVYSKNVRRLVQRQLKISNFIIPAILRGMFQEVVFLGKTLDPMYRKEHYLGTFGGTGKWIMLFDDKIQDVSRMFPDVKKWYYTVTDDLSRIALKNVVLDIDLDYFSSYLFPQMEKGILLTKRQLIECERSFLTNDDFKISFFPFTLMQGKHKHYTDTRFKHVLFNNSPQWIECGIRYFVESLKFRPEVVSICRSVTSGYLPRRFAQFTEETVKNYLRGTQKRTIDPCEISAPFEIYEFTVQMGKYIFNLLTGKKIALRHDTELVWKYMLKEKNFAQIFKLMYRDFDAPAEILKKEIVKFIFRLKRNFFIK